MRLSGDDYRKADKAFTRQIREDVERIEIPSEEFDRILKMAESGAGTEGTADERIIPWAPKLTPVPFRLTAAAAFLAGVIYLSVFASFGNDTFTFSGSDETVGGIVIEENTISDLKDSAGRFLWRVARSIKLNLIE